MIVVTGKDALIAGLQYSTTPRKMFCIHIIFNDCIAQEIDIVQLGLHNNRTRVSFYNSKNYFNQVIGNLYIVQDSRFIMYYR